MFDDRILAPRVDASAALVNFGILNRVIINDFPADIWLPRLIDVLSEPIRRHPLDGLRLLWYVLAHRRLLLPVGGKLRLHWFDWELFVYWRPHTLSRRSSHHLMWKVDFSLCRLKVQLPRRQNAACCRTNRIAKLVKVRVYLLFVVRRRSHWVLLNHCVNSLIMLHCIRSHIIGRKNMSLWSTEFIQVGDLGLNVTVGQNGATNKAARVNSGFLYLDLECLISNGKIASVDEILRAAWHSCLINVRHKWVVVCSGTWSSVFVVKHFCVVLHAPVNIDVARGADKLLLPHLGKLELFGTHQRAHFTEVINLAYWICSANLLVCLRRRNSTCLEEFGIKHFSITRA